MTPTAMIIFWAIAFVFFIVCEVATGTQLVSIWFAFGALISMFFAFFTKSFWIQSAVFVIVSILLLILTRPLVKKLQSKPTPTNFELDVGKTAIVIEEINNATGKGRVTLNGTNWAAKSFDDSIIQNGEIVTVEKVDGAKFIVRK